MNQQIPTNKKVLGAAVAMMLGVSGLPQMASAATMEFDWSGYFRILDPYGAALVNTSIPQKTANQYETPISGTLSFDPYTGAGTATLQPFSFESYANPAEMTGINLQAIGDGMGGPGTLVVANMLFNWGGVTGMPLSMVWDASGFFNSLPSIFADPSSYYGHAIGQSAPGSVRGAADGTYVGGSGTHITSGYLDLGVVPIATTKWNTTSTCTAGGGSAGACMGQNPSGGLPLVADTATNINDWNAFFMGGDGSNDDGMGGSPMPAGSLQGYNINIDIASLTFNSIIDVAPVPVPAAAWLLGSGILGLLGAARRSSGGV